MLCGSALHRSVLPSYFFIAVTAVTVVYAPVKSCVWSYRSGDDKPEVFEGGTWAIGQKIVSLEDAKVRDSLELGIWRYEKLRLGTREIAGQLKHHALDPASR